MKKYSKLIALILVIITLCVVLCSCDAIDEMRTKQGFFQEDGTIFWNGNTYLQLEYYTQLAGYGYGDNIYITQKDVPVLLSPQFSHYFDVTKDCVVLDDGIQLYARADKYAEVNKEAEKAVEGEFDKFIIEFYDDNYDIDMKTATSNETQVINSIVNEESPISFDGEWVEKELSLYTTTESGYFGHYFGTIFMLSDGSYVIQADKYYETVAYLVPEKYQKDMEDIFSRLNPQ